MSVEIFELQILNNPSRQYTSGETIHGVVIVSTKTFIDIRGILIYVQGTGSVEWNEQGTRVCWCCCRRKGEPYTATNDFYNHSFYVHGTGKQKLTIPPGLYHYPFRHKLPRGLPSSFHSENGKLEYTIKAEMEFPPALTLISKHKSNPLVEVPFTVHGILDLNEERTASQPVHARKSHEIKSLFCSNYGQIGMVLQLPKSGFSPGELVQFTVEIKNESTKDIVETTGRLLKDITYHGHIKTKVFRREELIQSVDGPRLIASGASEHWRGSFNLSPYSPPNHLAHGLISKEIIDVNYFVEIVVKAAGFLTKNKLLRLKTPIIIGSTTTITKGSYSRSQSYS